MSRTPNNEPRTPQNCDLCGSTAHRFVLATERLDGPLVQCQACGLFYVLLPVFVDRSPAETLGPGGAQSETETMGETGFSSLKPLLASTLSAPFAVATVPKSQHAADEMQRLSQRAHELALVEPQVEESERPWRALMAQERVGDLRRFVSNGRLLEVGSSTGEFLQAASVAFDATGIEADRDSSAFAQARGLRCINSTLTDAQFPAEHFAAAATYHVIEHFRSPRAELNELHRVLQPGGWLIIETPNIDTLWFRLLGARWRQFIPDHIFFFTPHTLTRLCTDAGFAVREIRSVGKAMSVRLFISRIGRYNRPLAQALNIIAARLNAHDRTLTLKLGDVMRVYARKLPYPGNNEGEGS